MTKIFKIILIASITLLGTGILSLPQVQAQSSDLVVEFENTPLFKEANFLPGENISRWVKVTNNSSESKNIAVEAINIIDTDGLGEVLNLEIKEESTSLFNGSLSDFFGAGEYFLSELSDNSSTQYDFIVNFIEGAENDYQSKTLSFDILIGSQGTGGEAPPGGNGGGGGGGFVPPGLTILEESVISTDITDTSITILWSTSYFSTSQVIYAAEGELYSFNLTSPNFGYPHAAPDPEDLNKVTNHSVTITGLIPDTTYYFRCVSHASPPSVSRKYSFVTLEGENLEKQVKGAETEDYLAKIDLEGISEELEQGKKDITGETEEQDYQEGETIEEDKKDIEKEETEEDLGDKFLGTISRFFSASNWKRSLLIFLILVIIFLIILFFLRKKKLENRQY